MTKSKIKAKLAKKAVTQPRSSNIKAQLTQKAEEQIREENVQTVVACATPDKLAELEAWVKANPISDEQRAELYAEWEAAKKSGAKQYQDAAKVIETILRASYKPAKPAQEVPGVNNFFRGKGVTLHTQGKVVGPIKAIGQAIMNAAQTLAKRKGLMAGAAAFMLSACAGERIVYVQAPVSGAEMPAATQTVQYAVPANATTYSTASGAATTLNGIFAATSAGLSIANEAANLGGTIAATQAMTRQSKADAYYTRSRGEALRLNAVANLVRAQTQGKADIIRAQNQGRRNSPPPAIKPHRPNNGNNSNAGRTARYTPTKVSRNTHRGNQGKGSRGARR